MNPGTDPTPQEQSAPQSQTTPEPEVSAREQAVKRVGFVGRFRQASTKKKLLTLGVTALLLLVLVFSVYQYALSVMANTEVEVQGVRILSSGEDNLSLEIEFVVDNPSSQKAKLQDSEFWLSYLGERAARVSLPELEVEPGSNHFLEVMELTEENETALRQLASDVLGPGEVVVELEGSVQTKGLISLTLPVKKELLLEDLGNIEVELEEVRLPSHNESGIRVELDLVVRNPGILATTLEGLEFTIFNQGLELGVLSTNGSLESGDNQLTLSFLIPAEAEEAALGLRDSFITGSSSQFEVVGRKGSTLLSRLTTAFNYSLDSEESELGSFADIGIQVQNIEVTGSDSNGVWAEVEAVVTNPTKIGLTLEGLGFEVLYNGSRLGIFATGGYLDLGQQNLTIHLLVPASSSDTANRLVEALLAGGANGFLVRGLENRGFLLTKLSTLFSFNYIMEVPGQIRTEVTDFSISSIGLFSSRVSIRAHLENTAPLTVNLRDFDFSVYYQGSRLGSLSFSDPVVVPGNQSLSLSLTVSTISLQNLGILTRLALGQPIELVVKGEKIFNSENALRFYIDAKV